MSDPLAACLPIPTQFAYFNPQAHIPFGCTIEHVYAAMREFEDFLGFINQQLNSRAIERLETMLMSANFSSIVGEFVAGSLPKHCPTLVRNRYHNGHPDLIPAQTFANDAVQYAAQGIEIKASRYLRGWQGHNPEASWLMVFVFDSNRASDAAKSIPPRSFRFLRVYGAQLMKEDWVFSGRSETSRRTITASVTRSGYDKLTSNWIYRLPS